MSAVSLSALSDTVASLPDPRSKQGVSHPYHGMLSFSSCSVLSPKYPPLLLSGDGQKDTGTLSANPSNSNATNPLRRPRLRRCRRRWCAQPQSGRFSGSVPLVPIQIVKVFDMPSAVMTLTACVLLDIQDTKRNQNAQGSHVVIQCLDRLEPAKSAAA